MTAARYPVYVISKGRAAHSLTARFLVKDKVPFKLVVEPQEFDAYAAVFDKELIQVLPFSNLGLGSIPARNWVWEHAKASGAERHWILDDNIRDFDRFYRGYRIRCESSLAFRVTEDFIDRYENIAIGGMNYTMFCMTGGSPNPFVRNAHVYSCLLIKNDLPFRWRGRYNEDTDLCLQVLSGGWCTVLFNSFLIRKMPSMHMKGGNTAELYQGDGRLKMARSLERVWPGVVTTKRKFQRPQHCIKGSWRYFDTPLRLKPDADLSRKDYGIQLVAVKPIESETLRALVDDYALVGN
jgi:hypothetical protein